MAGHRVKGVLPTFQEGEKGSRPAANVASYCGGIFANAEDVDGQVEGSNHVITSPSDLLTRNTPIRRTIGERCHVRLPDF